MRSLAVLKPKASHRALGGTPYLLPWVAAEIPDATLDECCKVMEENQIRRVPVVDAGGACVGIVAQADIARHAAKRDIAEVVKEVSKPSAAASGVG